MKNNRILIFHFTALVLFVIYFAAAGYSGILTYRSIIRRIVRYQFWESWVNPRGLNDQLSDYVLYNIPNRDTLIRNIYSYLMLAQDKKESRNFTVIKDDAGYLHQGDFYQLPNSAIRYFSLRVRALSNTFKNNSYHKGAFLALAGGNKLNAGSTPIYTGYPVNYMADVNLDSLLINLFQYGVETFDLRNVFKNSTMNYEEIYYKTDRGWSPMAALEAAGAIAARVKQKFGVSMDPPGEPAGFFRDANNYQKYQYYNAYQGAYSRTVGRPFGGDEDFIIPLPLFKTSFTVYDTPYSSMPIREGDFSDVLIDSDYLNANSRNLDPVSIFLYDENGQYSYRRIVNNSNPKGPNILFIGGMDFVPTAIYLSLMCRELTFISVESPVYNRLIDDLIAEPDSDCTIFGIEPDGINDSLFPFFKGSAY